MRPRLGTIPLGRTAARSVRHHLTRVALGLLSGVTVTVALGAQEGLRPSASRDTVRGTVFDSLSGTPLAGAFVTADGNGAVTTTDSAGRFVLVADRRVQRLVAYHELLDRVGVGALRAERGEASGAWSPRLATPGMDVVWARFCSGRRPRNGDGGIVFGRTMASDGATRLAGAQVELQWERLEARRDTRRDTMPSYDMRVVRSDSAGDYVVCGVQEFGPAGVIAVAPGLRSSALLLPGDVVPVRRADLLLGATADTARVLVEGIVQDTDGQPVPDATISIDGVLASVRSGADGRFRMANVPTGTRMLSARKVGLLPYLAPLDVLDRGVTSLVVAVERGVTIEGVRITARSTLSRDRREFEERARTGMGVVMDSTTLAKFPRLQFALRQYPSVLVSTANNGVDFTLLGRVGSFGRRCVAQIYVDGVLEDSAYLAILSVDAIAATELYPSGSFAPVRFRSGSTCAVLLVWTKNFLRG